MSAWQHNLLHWYQQNKRDLPWRRTSDPYAIWVSEIMLQQTTVETVIPYYHRFLERFPTVQELVEAEEQEVLRLWSGLGYYSRARNLHKAARQIAGHVGAYCNTPLPKTVEALMQLPGIGRYTAGAIASIAFNQPAPILDGNVMRVLARLFKIKQDPKSSRGQKYFWKISENVLHDLCRGGVPPPGRGHRAPTYGDFNQALMELGATTCTPESPKCPVCPIREDCQAHQAGQAEHYPRIQQKIKYRDVLMTAALVERSGKFLLVQRPNQGLMKGLWEFPMMEGSEAELAKTFSLRLVKPLRLVRHSVLNKRIQVRPFLCRLAAGVRPAEPLQDRPHRWILPEELRLLPTSSMNYKILKSLEATN